jgi:hypothetical protein
MMRNLVIVITLALLPLNIPSSFAQEKRARGENYDKGRIEAAENIKKGKYIIKAWGLSPHKLHPWPSRDEIYFALLKEKYKIAYDWVGECIVDEETVGYAVGYNEVSKVGIESKYGKDILEEVRKQANDEYESKYGEMEREYNRKMKEAIESLPKRNEY